MKKAILITIILTSPVFAACPIDNLSGACVAEFDSSKPSSSIIRNEVSKDFVGVTPLNGLERETKNIDSLRNFSPTNQDYNYNSNCQFGICSNSGASKTFIYNKD